MYFVKSKKLKRFFSFSCFLVAFVLFAAADAYSGWDIYKRTKIKNKQGHRLRFELIDHESVRIRFRLTRRDKGVFSKELPVYRVDDNKVHKIDRGNKYKDLEITAGRNIGWTISDAETYSEELMEFINGREVVLQYYRDDGKIMEIVFNLAGIKEALDEILK